MTVTFGVALGLIGWATIAGLDLASVLQALFSRPIVAGPVAGLVIGDPETGLRVGVALELFALDVVPVGAARYPDFGAAAVASVSYAAGTAWTESLGAAVGLGLVFAGVGGMTVPVTRRLNARVVRGNAERLAGGESRAVEQVHLRCLLHDVVRSVGLAVVWTGIALALAAADLRPSGRVGELLTLIGLGGAGWAVAHGAMASARVGRRWRWALLGVLAGTLGLLR